MANKFERDVQKKLEALQFAPSPTVWQEVEKRIAPKRRRRPFLLILPLLILIAIIGTYLLVFRESRLPDSNQQENLLQSGTVIKEKEQADRASEYLTPNTQPDSPNKVSPKNRPSPNKDFTSQNYIRRKYTRAKEQSPPISNSLKNESRTRSQAGLLPKALPHPVPSNIFPGLPVQADITSRSQRAISFAQKKYHLSETAANNRGKPRLAKDFPNDSLSAVVNDRESKSKWAFDLSFIPGIANVSRNFLELSGNSPAYDYSNYPGTGTGMPPSGSLPPNLKTGFSFSIAVNALKPLSEKTAFHAGLEYQYLSLQQHMPARTGLGNNPNPDSRFLNQFHYLTIPASFRFGNQLGNKRLMIEVGTGVSALVSAHALHFDQGRYFQDRSAWHRLQYQAMGGIYIDLLEENTFRLLAGPYYQYNLNQPAKKGIFADKHFNFAGLKMEIQLKNK